MPLDVSRPQATRPILAVVVAYHGETSALRAMTHSLVDLGLADVLVIDNTESDAHCTDLRVALAALGAEVFCQGTNQGVAAAHNLGLRIAREHGYEAALLLDQDSHLEDTAVPRLYRALQDLKANGVQVAALGTAFVDPRTNLRTPFYKLGRLRMKHLPDEPDAVTECEFVISSGTLIPREAIDAVGLMDEALFIDYVDMEWCVRARALGREVFGVPQARMLHTIGDGAMRVFGRVIPIHTPHRQYYLIRNALLFARKPYLPFKWRVHLVYRAVTQLAMFSLLCAPRLTRFGWLLRGFADGLLGRGGRLGGTMGLGVASGTTHRSKVADDQATELTPLAK